MKRKIKVKLYSENCLPIVDGKNNLKLFVRLVSAFSDIQKNQDGCSISSLNIPLGVSIKAPDGCVCKIKAKDEALARYSIALTNKSDLTKSYCVDEDKEWSVFVIALKKVNIIEGENLFYCEIVPSENATLWQKIKWILTTKYELIVE